MTTVEIPDNHLTWGEIGKLVLDVLVPVLLMATIISLILFRADVTSRFDRTAKDTRDTACAAVKASNDSLDLLLEDKFHFGDTPDGALFLAGLRQDHEQVYQDCLSNGTLGT